MGEPFNRIDMVSGAVAAVTNGGDIAPGGFLSPLRSSSSATAKMLRFPTNVGLGSATEHIAVALVGGSTSSTSGPIWKIGNSSNGYAVSHGNTDDDVSTGGRILFLREALGWLQSGSTSAWINGAQLVFGGRTTSAWFAHNYATGSEANTVSGIAAPSSVLYINGRNDSVSSPFRVHAFALFRRSYTDAEASIQRALLGEPLRQLQGLPSQAVAELFRTRRALFPVSAGTPSLPTLSALTTKPGTLTSTGFTTRVTAS